MKRVNYHLTEEQIGRLQSLSGKTGLTVAEIIRRSVDEYLDKRKVQINLKMDKKIGIKEKSGDLDKAKPKNNLDMGKKVMIK